MKIRPVAAALFHSDGRTDMTKLTVTFRNFANAPKTQFLKNTYFPSAPHFVPQKLLLYATYHNTHLAFPSLRLLYQTTSYVTIKVKVIPQQAEMAQGVPGRLRSRIFLTFSTTRVVGRQPYAPAAFTPGEIPGTHF